MRHAAILHVIGRAMLAAMLTTAVILTTGSPLTSVTAAPYDYPGVGLHADSAPVGGDHALTGTTSGQGPSNSNLETISAGRYDLAHAEAHNAVGNIPLLSFMGGSSDDCATGVAVDDDGNIYITGRSNGPWTGDLATTVRPYSHASSGYDAFVAKLNSAGELQWKTFLGSDGGWDGAESIALDSDGSIYVAGSSDTSWGTPLDGYEHAGYGEVFIAKLDNSGELQWHVFVGGPFNPDNAHGITTYGSDVYVCGYGADWGSPIQPHSGAEDAFVAKFSGSGELQWNTFLGSSENDVAYSIEVDMAGNIYVGGRRENPGDYDYNGFVAKLSNGEGGSATEGELVWLSQLGSAGGTDEVRDIALTETAVYAAGFSEAQWGSPVSAYTAGRDGFVAVLASSDGAALWHTFLGGASSDEIHAIDVAGHCIGVAGWSNGTWQGSGSTDPVQDYSGLGDAFVAMLDRTTLQYQWHTFLGDDATDDAEALTIGSGFIYVAGNSGSSWGEPVEAFSASQDAFVAVLEIGHAGSAVWATGDNLYGQLGDGTQVSRYSPVQVLDAMSTSLSGVVSIAAGYWHSLALLTDGTVWAWGYNGYGQLGDGSNDDSSVPVQVMTDEGHALTDVTAITAGRWHSLALLADGTVYAWGHNYYGQLGNGTNDNSSVPVQVMTDEDHALTGITAIAAGANHSLAVKSNGTLWTWGRNWKGELGDGNSGSGTDRNTPYQVAGLSTVVAAAGGEHHSLALLTDGTVRAWGWNLFGQLGNGSSGSYSDQLTPVAVIASGGFTNVSAIAAGYQHSLAIKSDGTAWAWGKNDYGQLGNDSTTNRSNPYQVSSLSGVAAITGGEWHSLALKSDGTVWGWGMGSDGQLGGASAWSQVKVPVQMLVISDACAITAGGMHSLILQPHVADTTEDMTIELAGGWNLISVPMVVGTNTVAAIFDEVAYEIIYKWNSESGGSYAELTDQSVIDPYRAYWVKLAAPAQLSLSGEPADDADWFSGLSEGWNMVGIPYSADPVPFNDFWDSDSSGVLTDHIYYWNVDHYERVTGDDDMIPGVGYWMACMPVR